MSVPEKLSAAVLFEPAPDKWGLRGDPHLWKDMQHAFQSVWLPISAEEFTKKINDIFEKITGERLSVTCRPRLSRYGSGGMSGGQVSGAFWLNEVLPMLVERLVTYSLPAAADPAPAAGAPLSDTAQAYGTAQAYDTAQTSGTAQAYDIVLQTPRLYLRKIRIADRPAIGSILQDAEVMYAWEHAFSDDEVTDWMEQNLMRYDRDGYSYWAVMEKSTGDLVGLCGLLAEKAGEESDLGVGYIFGKKYWHRGYAQESASACVDYAFRTLGAGHVTAQIRPNNLPSVKVAERLGMTVRSQFLKRYRGKDMIHLIYYLEKQDKKAGNSYDQKDLH